MGPLIERDAGGTCVGAISGSSSYDIEIDRLGAISKVEECRAGLLRVENTGKGGGAWVYPCFYGDVLGGKTVKHSRKGEADEVVAAIEIEGVAGGLSL